MCVVDGKVWCGRDGIVDQCGIYGYVGYVQVVFVYFDVDVVIVGLQYGVGFFVYFDDGVMCGVYGIGGDVVMCWFDFV